MAQRTRYRPLVALKAFRERHNPPLSQSDLADKFGVSRVTVTRWESGSRQPNRDVLPTVLRITGLPLSEIRPDLAKLIAYAA